MNCLEHSLELWTSQRTLKLWYNSNHVVIIEPEFDLTVFGYLEFKEFGYEHFVKSFAPGRRHKRILKEYFNEPGNS